MYFCILKSTQMTQILKINTDKILRASSACFKKTYEFRNARHKIPRRSGPKTG